MLACQWTALWFLRERADTATWLTNHRRISAVPAGSVSKLNQLHPGSGTAPCRSRNFGAQFRVRSDDDGGRR